MSISSFRYAAVSTGTATPTLIQFVASSANPVGQGIQGNNYKIPLPNSVGSGNCLVLEMTYTNGSTPTITDNISNSWSSTPVVSADGGAGNYIKAVFVLPNSNSGLITITVSFGAVFQPFQYSLSEWNNIALSSPVNGTSSINNIHGASLAPGSFTPTTNNDANGGNLILAFYSISAAASSNPSSWVAGTNFTLLDGDVSWVSNNGFPHASQYFVQTTQAAINPTITATGDTANFYNCVAIALKISSAGTSIPAGIRIQKVIHQTNPTSNTSWVLQTPAVGNLRVVTGVGGNITGITDNESGSWTLVGSVAAQLLYSVNKSVNTNLTLTIATSGGPLASIRFYDIKGAAASPFDVSAQMTSTVFSGLSTIAHAPDITPTTSNGLVIADLQIGQGPGLAVTSPTNSIWDLCTYTGETDLDLMENADGNSHLYNSNTSAENWTWTITNQASNSGTAVAAAFKTA